jgi:segregation and condensation protein B
VTDAEIKKILEALLLVTDKSLMMDQIKEVFGEQADLVQIHRLFTELAQEYDQAGRGIRIEEVADGFQMVTDPDLAEHVMKLTRRVRSVKLSKPALETLAIIAYRQPLTRIEIEQVRGVDAGGVLETLLKFNLVRVVGRKEVVGRPLLYETTREFLDHFGLKNLEDLPTLDELKGAPGTPGGPQQAVPQTETSAVSAEPSVTTNAEQKTNDAETTPQAD